MKRSVDDCGEMRLQMRFYIAIFLSFHLAREQNKDAQASRECSNTLDESWLTITLFENSHIFQKYKDHKQTGPATIRVIRGNQRST